jgi:hypothetical protein
MDSTATLVQATPARDLSRPCHLSLVPPNIDRINALSVMTSVSRLIASSLCTGSVPYVYYCVILYALLVSRTSVMATSTIYSCANSVRLSELSPFGRCGTHVSQVTGHRPD